MRNNRDTKITDLFKADLILHNGKVATLDEDDSVFPAVAVKDGKILLLGEDALVLQLAGSGTEIIDLSGRLVLPGIIESHVHPDIHAMFIHKWSDVSWPSIRSVDDCLSVIREKTSDLPVDHWFLGFGYDDQKVGGYPTIDQLDQASGGRPVLIVRTDYHVAIANHAAFKLCRVDKSTPNPPHGQFDRDPATGDLTGLTRETATRFMVNQVEEHYTLEELVEALPPLLEDYRSYGITSIHHSLTWSNGLRAYQILREQGRLPLRVGVIISGWEAGLPEAFIRSGIRTGFGDDWLRIIGVEWSPDNSTSGRTAAYYDPYVGKAAIGEPTPNYGFLNPYPFQDLEELKTSAIKAHKAGLRLCMDGIGDRGIDFILDTFEEALAAHPVEDHRMRIEHCSYVPPKILERIKRLKVIDSSATGFMYDLGDAYIAARGKESMKWMFPHRALIDEGVPAPGHSDAFVCHVNPMRGVYSMVTRKTDTGQDFGPEQAVTVKEAVRAYTVSAAYAGFEEHTKGTIEPGKLADMVVYDRDVFLVATSEILEVRADMTIVGGAVHVNR